MENLTLSYDKLCKITESSGANLCGVSEAKSLGSKAFKKWQDKGGQGDLEYLKKDPDFYFTPTNLLKEAKSVLIFLFFYEDSSYNLLECPSGFARVARFAYGKNYHKVIKKNLESIAKLISEEIKSDDFKYRVFVDAVPLQERSFARNANLGFIGNSSMLVNEDFGSYFFISEIITNITITDIPIKKRREYSNNCDSCNNCLKACVNNVKKEGFFSVNRCTSYLTIEKKGVIKKEDWKLLGDWIFGCDFCQVACPFNAKGKKIAHRLNLGASITKNGLVSIKDLLTIKDDKEFLKRFAGTSFMRAKRENIIRNSLIVLANQKNIKFLDIIESLSNNDESRVVRCTAKEVFEELLLSL
ncbi:MAG: tRNA epoxyqueuosine(34) reductase QueG [Bdellovibrionota bacterium]